MKSCLVVAMIVTVVFAQVAVAQELQPPSSTPVQPAPAGWQQRSPRFDKKVPGEIDEHLALGAPLMLTLLSWTVMAGSVEGGSGGGFLVGAIGALTLPSAGKWYAGEVGGVGLLTRGAGAALFLSAVLRAERYTDSCDEDCGAPSDVEVRAWLGIGLLVAGTIYDLATSPSAARAHNERLRKTMVVPTAQPGGGGLALVGQF